MHLAIVVLGEEAGISKKATHRVKPYEKVAYE